MVVTIVPAIVGGDVGRAPSVPPAPPPMSGDVQQTPTYCFKDGHIRKSLMESARTSRLPQVKPYATRHVIPAGKVLGQVVTSCIRYNSVASGTNSGAANLLLRRCCCCCCCCCFGWSSGRKNRRWCVVVNRRRSRHHKVLNERHIGLMKSYLIFLRQIVRLLLLIIVNILASIYLLDGRRRILLWYFPFVRYHRLARHSAKRMIVPDLTASSLLDRSLPTFSPAAVFLSAHLSMKVLVTLGSGHGLKLLLSTKSIFWQRYAWDEKWRSASEKCKKRETRSFDKDTLRIENDSPHKSKKRETRSFNSNSVLPVLKL